MSYYRFEADGFKGAHEFCVDDAAAIRMGFDIAIEFTRSVGHLVFIDVSDAKGKFVARVPHLPEAHVASVRRP